MPSNEPDFKKIKAELITLKEDIAEKLNKREFYSFGDLREFFEEEIVRVKSIGLQLKDVSAVEYRTLW